MGLNEISHTFIDDDSLPELDDELIIVYLRSDSPAGIEPVSTLPVSDSSYAFAKSRWEAGCQGAGQVGCKVAGQPDSGITWYPNPESISEAEGGYRGTLVNAGESGSNLTLPSCLSLYPKTIRPGEHLSFTADDGFPCESGEDLVINAVALTWIGRDEGNIAFSLGYEGETPFYQSEALSKNSDLNKDLPLRVPLPASPEQKLVWTIQNRGETSSVGVVLSNENGADPGVYEAKTYLNLDCRPSLESIVSCGYRGPGEYFVNGECLSIVPGTTSTPGDLYSTVTLPFLDDEVTPDQESTNCAGEMIPGMKLAVERVSLILEAHGLTESTDYTVTVSSNEDILFSKSSADEEDSWLPLTPTSNPVVVELYPQDSLLGESDSISLHGLENLEIQVTPNPESTASIKILPSITTVNGQRSYSSVTLAEVHPDGAQVCAESDGSDCLPDSNAKTAVPDEEAPKFVWFLEQVDLGNGSRVLTDLCIDLDRSPDFDEELCMVQLPPGEEEEAEEEEEEYTPPQGLLYYAVVYGDDNGAPGTELLSVPQYVLADDVEAGGFQHVDLRYAGTGGGLLVEDGGPVWVGLRWDDSTFPCYGIAVGGEALDPEAEPANYVFYNESEDASPSSTWSQIPDVLTGEHLRIRLTHADPGEGQFACAGGIVYDSASDGMAPIVPTVDIDPDPNVTESPQAWAQRFYQSASSYTYEGVCIYVPSQQESTSLVVSLHKAEFTDGRTWQPEDGSIPSASFLYPIVPQEGGWLTLEFETPITIADTDSFYVKIIGITPAGDTVSQQQEILVQGGNGWSPETSLAALWVRLLGYPGSPELIEDPNDEDTPNNPGRLYTPCLYSGPGVYYTQPFQCLSKAIPPASSNRVMLQPGESSTYLLDLPFMPEAKLRVEKLHLAAFAQPGGAGEAALRLRVETDEEVLYYSQSIPLTAGTLTTTNINLDYRAFIPQPLTHVNSQSLRLVVENIGGATAGFFHQMEVPVSDTESETYFTGLRLSPGVEYDPEEVNCDANWLTEFNSKIDEKEAEHLEQWFAMAMSNPSLIGFGAPELPGGWYGADLNANGIPDRLEVALVYSQLCVNQELRVTYLHNIGVLRSVPSVFGSLDPSSEYYCDTDDLHACQFTEYLAALFTLDQRTQNAYFPIFYMTQWDKRTLFKVYEREGSYYPPLSAYGDYDNDGVANLCEYRYVREELNAGRLTRPLDSYVLFATTANRDSLPTEDCGVPAPEGWPVVEVQLGMGRAQLRGSGATARLESAAGATRWAVEPGSTVWVEVPAQAGGMHFTGWTVLQGEVPAHGDSPSISISDVRDTVVLSAGYVAEQIITFRVTGSGGGHMDIVCPPETYVVEASGIELEPYTITYEEEDEAGQGVGEAQVARRAVRIAKARGAEADAEITLRFRHWFYEAKAEPRKVTLENYEAVFVGWDGAPEVAGITDKTLVGEYAPDRFGTERKWNFTSLSGSAVVEARFEDCDSLEGPLTLIDMGTELDSASVGVSPPGWQAQGANGRGIVVGEDATGKYWTNVATPRDFELLRKRQGWADTEITFSYRFGYFVHPSQAIVVQPRSKGLDGKERVALQIYPESIKLINAGIVDGQQNTDVVSVSHYSAWNVWYDVMVRTAGDKCYVWTKQQAADPVNWDVAITQVPPVLVYENNLHATTSESTLVGFITKRYYNTEQLYLKNLHVESYVCGDLPLIPSLEDALVVTPSIVDFGAISSNI